MTHIDPIIIIIIIIDDDQDMPDEVLAELVIKNSRVEFSDVPQHLAN